MPAERAAQSFVGPMGAELHGRHSRPEHLRGFGHRQALTFDEIECDPLRLGKLRQLRQEQRRQLGGFEELIGGCIGGHDVRRGIIRILREDFAFTSAHAVNHQAPGDGKSPRDDVGACDEAPPRAMHLEHRLLDEILGARMIAGLTKEVTKEARRQPVVELAERRVVAFGVAIHGYVELARRGHAATCNTFTTTYSRSIKFRRS